MRYKVALRRTEEGFSVSVPGVAGCWSQGDAEAEALENIEDAILEHLNVARPQLDKVDIPEVDVAVSWVDS
jgi:predicted RNase H-like HicB family nuclease